MKKNIGPPRICAGLLEFFAGHEKKFSSVGDFDEEFYEVAAEKGIPAARRWYRRQVLKSLPQMMRSSLSWSISMFHNYLKIGLRNILRNRSYAFINLLGLALGLAAVLMILLYVQYEFSYDGYNANIDNIYRIGRILPPGHTHSGKTRSATTVSGLAPVMAADFPEVLKSARICEDGQVLLKVGKNSYYEKNAFWVDSDLFSIFTFAFVEGNPETALNAPNSILLSERMARKFFGGSDPIGKLVTYDNLGKFQVTGVVADIPANSHVMIDFYLPLQYMERYRENRDLNGWHNNRYYSYVLLAEGASPETVTEKIPAIFKQHLDPADRMFDRLYCAQFLQKVSDIHLHNDLDAEPVPVNSMTNIFLSVTIAFSILLIACINYMNIATARSVHRAREVGIRKIVGAYRNQIIRQFYGESFLYVMLALIVSLIIVAVSLPVFNSFIERELSLKMLLQPKVITGMGCVILLIVLAAGSYPALFISSYKPAMILKGSHKGKRRGRSVRNVLVVLQFSISVILLISTFVFRSQISFIKSMDVGFEKDHIVVVDLKDEELQKNTDRLKEALLVNSSIISASGTYHLPNAIHSELAPNWPGKPEGEANIDVYFTPVDFDYLDVFGIELTKGRTFSRGIPSDGKCSFIINERLADALGWTDPVGREMLYWDGTKGKVIGVVKNFNFHNLHRHIEPMLLYLSDTNIYYRMAIKIRGENLHTTVKFIEKTVKKLSPDYPVEYKFFDDIFNQQYKTEFKLQQIFNVFTLLAIAIACMGLFGLAAFSIEQRAKEICIRKIVGASVPRLVLMLSKEFTQWVVISNIIAWPAAFYILNKWLQNFAYRVDLRVQIFLISGVLALCIALLTTGYQAIRAASAKPVNSLKYE